MRKGGCMLLCALPALLLLSAFAPCAAASPMEGWQYCFDADEEIFTIHPERRLFYDNATDRWWVFYDTGNYDTYYASAPANFTSWTAPVSISTALLDYHDFWIFNGTVHKSEYKMSPSTGYVKYQRGTLNANGTITWAGSTYYAVGTGPVFQSGSITVTATGYPVVIWMENTGSYYYYAKVATKQDGSAWGAGVRVFGRGSAGWSKMVPFPDGRVLAIHGMQNTPFEYNIYNGSWAGWANITGTNLLNHNFWDVAFCGEEVVLVWLDTNYEIRYAVFNGTSWGSAVSTGLISARQGGQPSVAPTYPGNYRVFFYGPYNQTSITELRYFDLNASGRTGDVVLADDLSLPYDGWQYNGWMAASQTPNDQGYSAVLSAHDKTTYNVYGKMFIDEAPEEEPSGPTATVYNLTIAHFTLFSTNPFIDGGSWDGIMEGKLTFVTHGDVNITSSQGWYLPFTVSHNWQYWTEWEYANPPDMIRIYGLPGDAATWVDFTLPTGGVAVDPGSDNGGTAPSWPINPTDNPLPAEQNQTQPSGGGTEGEQQPVTGTTPIDSALNQITGGAYGALPPAVKTVVVTSFAGIPLMLLLLLIVSGRAVQKGTGGRFK